MKNVWTPVLYSNIQCLQTQVCGKERNMMLVSTKWQDNTKPTAYATKKGSNNKSKLVDIALGYTTVKIYLLTINEIVEIHLKGT